MTIAAFFHFLNWALTTRCDVLVGHAPGPLAVRFGGNCWDALSYAPSLGGWASVVG